MERDTTSLLSHSQRLATLYGEAFGAGLAILLDRMGHREAAVTIGSIALAAGFLTSMILLHEDKNLPPVIMRGVLVAIASKAVMILYAVWEMTFGSLN